MQQERLSVLTIVLHWLVALFMIVLVGVGIYMSNNEAYSMYPIHKSVGIIALVFIIARILWRIKEGWPKPVGNYSVIEKMLSKIVHWLLVLATLMFPISGMMMSSMGGHGLSVFGLELFAPNIVGGRPAAINETLASFGSSVHELLVPVILIALVLHIVGAYKHHLIDKDNTMLRMLGKKRK